MFLGVYFTQLLVTLGWASVGFSYQTLSAFAQYDSTRYIIKVRLLKLRTGNS